MNKTIVECSLLFDGEQVHRDARVIIEGEHITAVETIHQENGRGVDDTTLRCHFAMPGLIDSHAHAFGYKESPPGIPPFEPHENVLRLMLYAGVTTVREMGNSIEVLRFLNHWTNEVRGPRLYSVGPVLDDLPLAVPVARLVHTELDASCEVEHLASAGVWAIKAHRHITPPLLSAIVSAARRKDRSVAVHLGATTAKEAANAGVRNIEHIVDFLDPSWFPGGLELGALNATQKLILWSHVDLKGAHVDALIQTLVSRGIVVCPTLLATRHAVLLDEVINDPFLDYMVAILPYHRHLKSMRNAIGYAVGKHYMNQHLSFPSLTKPMRLELENGLERLQAFLLLLHERGVQVVVGTDAPNPSVAPGFSTVQEMRLWIQCGMPALDVLRAATGRAADAMGLSDVGRIRRGAAADLLLLDRDPREEIGALERPSKQVICRGQLVDRPRLKAELVSKIEAVASKH